MADRSEIGYVTADLVDPGGWVTLGTLTGQTLMVTPRYPGQLIRVGAQTVTTVTAEVPVRIYGTGIAELGAGWWDQIRIYDGEVHDTSWWDGDTIGARTDVAAIDVQRRVNTGDWDTIATGLDPLSTWTDRTAPIAGDVAWRAVTTSADGATNPGRPRVLAFRQLHDGVPEGAQRIWIGEGYLSAGEDLADVARLWAGFDASEPEYGLDDITLHRFAGDPWPTQYAGIGMRQVVDVTATTLPAGGTSLDGVPAATLEDLRRVIAAHGPKLWRDPDGRAFPVSVGLVGIERAGQGHHQVKVQLTRIADRHRKTDGGEV